MPIGPGDEDRVAGILRTLGHPLRLRILSLLCGGDETVGVMAVRLGTKQSTVSQALAILRRERLVAVTRRDRLALYRLEAGTLRELIPCIRRTLSPAARRASGDRAAQL